MKHPNFFLLMAILGASCSLKEDPTTDFAMDLCPPRLISMESASGPEVSLYFDEPLRLTEETVMLDNGTVASLSLHGENGLIITPGEPLEPGQPYAASLSVEDKQGNSNNFLIRLWGWNPRLPGLVINEFNPEGSGNNPDTLELFFTTGGNTAGLTLCYGTQEHYEYRYILPSLEVSRGDYLLIHCRPEGISEEKNERENKDESGGKLASPLAWDLWLPEDAGLSGRNGVLSVYGMPTGELKDCVIYSDRQPDPEDDRLGWTSRTFDAVADLYESGDWYFSSEEISPLEAVRSDYTTGTRSLCRSSTSRDTDRSKDWHTVPTGGKTFGSPNTDAVHSP